MDKYFIKITNDENFKIEKYTNELIKTNTKPRSVVRIAQEVEIFNRIMQRVDILRSEMLQNNQPQQHFSNSNSLCKTKKSSNIVIYSGVVITFFALFLIFPSIAGLFVTLFVIGYIHKYVAPVGE